MSTGNTQLTKKQLLALAENYGDDDMIDLGGDGFLENIRRLAESGFLNREQQEQIAINAKRTRENEFVDGSWRKKDEFKTVGGPLELKTEEQKKAEAVALEAGKQGARNTLEYLQGLSGRTGSGVSTNSELYMAGAAKAGADAAKQKAAADARAGEAAEDGVSGVVAALSGNPSFSPGSENENSAYAAAARNGVATSPDRGRGFSTVTRTLEGGDGEPRGFVQTKVYSKGVEPPEGGGTVVDADGQTKPINQVTAALSEQQDELAAPSIVSAYEKAALQSTGPGQGGNATARAAGYDGAAQEGVTGSAKVRQGLTESAGFERAVADAYYAKDGNTPESSKVNRTGAYVVEKKTPAQVAAAKEPEDRLKKMREAAEYAKQNKANSTRRV
jgi:hypothetical protein